MEGMEDEYFEAIISPFPNKLCASTVKFWQSLIIYRAGINVTMMPSMKGPVRYNKMLEALTGHANQLINNAIMMK